MAKASAQAIAAHQKFLKKMGCLPEQLKESKKFRKKPRTTFSGFAETYYENKSLSTVMAGDQDTGTKRDVISNIYKETPEVQRQILEKASRVAIPYNKGGYQLITPGMDTKNIGRK
jgi:hypothetical protein